jgi:hypothetical protein
MNKIMFTIYWIIVLVIGFVSGVIVTHDYFAANSNEYAEQTIKTYCPHAFYTYNPQYANNNSVNFNFTIKGVSND